MHEFSLAQGLHDQLLGLVRQHDAKEVIQAEVGVGDNAGIVVDSFVFGFNVLAEQHEATDSMELIIVNTAGTDLVLQNVKIK